LLIFFILFFHVYVSPWFLCGLAKVAKIIMKELEIKFPAHGVMYVLGIVYPQYWLQLYYDASSANHLQVLKTIFCCGKTMWKVDEQKVQVQELLNATNFDYQ
jgi:hypothetical protein